MHLIIKFNFIIHLISFNIVIYHFLNFFIDRINFCFFRLNNLFIADFTKVFIHLNHTNFLNHRIFFYIFLFLTFPFIFNL